MEFSSPNRKCDNCQGDINDIDDNMCTSTTTKYKCWMGFSALLSPKQKNSAPQEKWVMNKIFNGCVTSTLDDHTLFGMLLCSRYQNLHVRNDCSFFLLCSFWGRCTFFALSTFPFDVLSMWLSDTIGLSSFLLHSVDVVIDVFWRLTMWWCFR